VREGEREGRVGGGGTCLRAKWPGSDNLHLTCTNMEKEKVDAALEGCLKAGITNIVALRGACLPPPPPRVVLYTETLSWTPTAQLNPWCPFRCF